MRCDYERDPNGPALRKHDDIGAAIRFSDPGGAVGGSPSDPRNHRPPATAFPSRSRSHRGALERGRYRSIAAVVPPLRTVSLRLSFRRTPGQVGRASRAEPSGSDTARPVNELSSHQAGREPVILIRLVVDVGAHDRLILYGPCGPPTRAKRSSSALAGCHQRSSAHLS
jgi:hypothetical protein